MKNKTYDTLKTIALIIVPVFAFISSMVDIWGIPYGSAITASLTAFDTLIGSLVLIAKKIYDGKTETEVEEEHD